MCLTVRKLVIYSRYGINNLEAYFIGCHRKILLVGTRDESYYTCSRDEYFITLGEMDDTEEVEQRKEASTGCDKLVKDIQAFLTATSFMRITDGHAAFPRDRIPVQDNSQTYGKEGSRDNEKGADDDGVRTYEPELQDKGKKLVTGYAA